jgi:predicted Ser/Thr protein kinase
MISHSMMTTEEGGPGELPAECRRRYRVERTLGAGGFGTALLARDLELNRLVVIKLLDRELAREAEAVARFQREARLTAQIQHENVVKVLDHGFSDGTPWIVYEFIEGRPLRERMEAGPVPARLAIEIALQVARALEAAHAAGILHRDVKPENVIEETGGRHRLIDFGIAKAEKPTQHTVSTKPGIVLGSPLYLSPEAIVGDPVDGRADLYALGVMLFEMVVGRPPFAGDSPMAILEGHLHEPPPAAPPPVDEVVARLLEKKPQRRFASAGELVKALAGLAPGARSRARGRLSAGVPRPSIAPAPSRQAPVAVALGAALLIAAGLAGLFARRAGERPPPPVPSAAPVRTSPTELDPARHAALDARTIQVGRRISERTRKRLETIGAVASLVSEEHCRGAAEDHAWMDATATALEEEFPRGYAPRDRVLVHLLLAKRYILRAVLEDAKGDFRLIAMMKTNEALYEDLDDGQGNKTLGWFVDYTRIVPPTLEALAVDDAAFARTRDVIWQHHEVCRSLLVYDRSKSFEERYGGAVATMIADVEKLAARPGRLGTVARLAEMAWRRGKQGLTLPKLLASHREARKFLEGNSHIPPAMARALYEHPFSER